MILAQGGWACWVLSGDYCRDGSKSHALHFDERTVSYALGHAAYIKIELIAYLALNAIIFSLLSQGTRVLRSTLIYLSMHTKRQRTGILM